MTLQLPNPPSIPVVPAAPPAQPVDALSVIGGVAVLGTFAFLLAIPVLGCIDWLWWYSLAHDNPGAGFFDYLSSWTAALWGWMLGFGLFCLFLVIIENLDDSPSYPPATTAYGTAKWAGRCDLSAANLLNSDGIVLGLIERERHADGTPQWDFLSYTNDAHLISVAPPGTGKFRDLLATAIMACRHSCIVIDPKGQAAAVTARGRREQGFETVIVNPFNVYPGLFGASATYNPMDNLDPDVPNFGADCDSLADAIVLHSDHHGDPHFSDSARSLVSGVIRYLAKYAPKASMKNLGVVRSIIAGPTSLLQSVCVAALKTGDRIISDKLARFASITDSDRELRSVISTAVTQTDFIGNEAIARNLTRSSFRFADLRRKQVTIYVVLPARYLDTCGKWFRLLVAGALHELINEGGGEKNPVLMVLDEFAQLGRMSAITTAMAIGRGYKLQVWPILQSLVQLRDLYGQGWESFMASADVRQFFAPRDHFTADYISSLAGVSSVDTVSHSTHGVTIEQRQQGLTGESYNYSNTQRPLMFADEIMRMGDDEQVLFTQGLPPISASRLPYFSEYMGRVLLDGRPLASLFDPDPQHSA